MRLNLVFPRFLHALACSCLLASVIFSPSQAQEAPQKPPDKKPEKEVQSEKSENPYQIELLETRYRFESNGDSRKQVHTRVHINNELGVRQFACLNFDYNRSFESIDIPLVHITHPSGGTADILPSAVTDQPNPAVVNAPAYQDVRIRSVRILGLEPGDLLDYRVITTTTHHPLAPDFWLDHSFDRSGIVTKEIFELDLPASRKANVRINPAMPATSTEKSGEGNTGRSLYRWQRSATDGQENNPSDSVKKSDGIEPDVVVSTFGAWVMLSVRLDERLQPGRVSVDKIVNSKEPPKELFRKPDITPAISSKALEITKSDHTASEKFEAIYDFVSQKIASVDLPLGATGFLTRPAAEILTSGYATQEDKFVLFAALSAASQLQASAALTGFCGSKALPRPSVFNHLLVSATDGKERFWLDPALEVAPFRMISPTPKKCAFLLERLFYVMDSVGHEWQTISTHLPFAAIQRVKVEAALAEDGKLTAKVHYSMRGDNELLLRVAFHQSPKEKWKELAQLLSISDGFRGQVTSASASDPYATKEPFTVDYEIVQPKFVDWSKRPVHIPALLPQLGLPDPPAKPSAGAAPSPVELGTPLEVETHMTLHLPPGTTIAPPTGTSVQRDYATFASQYSVKGLTVSASRQINFLLRQVPADRAADYNAFLHAVQSDQAQLFTLDRESPPAPATKPAASPATSSPTPKP